LTTLLSGISQPVPAVQRKLYFTFMLRFWLRGSAGAAGELFLQKTLIFGMRSADMKAMSEFTAWKIAVSAIVFLIGCAWHNWRTGYQKVAGSVNYLRDEMPDASPIWTPSAPPVSIHRGSTHAYTQQLINLNLALGNEPVPAASESADALSR
jgi:hypothetical protein